MRFRQNSFNRICLAILVYLYHRRAQQRGYTLVITIAVLLILVTLLVSYAITSKVDNTTSMSSAKSNTGFYAAEAGLNLRAQEFYEAFFPNYNSVPTGTAPADWKACLDATANQGSGDFQCRVSDDFVNESSQKDSFVQQIGKQKVITFAQEDPSNPAAVVIPKGELFGGLSAQESRYDVNSVARDNNNSPTAQLNIQFRRRLIPLFQFAAFYDQDMDLVVPDTIALNGSIHSNNNLYLDSLGTLTIPGQVTTAKMLYRGSRVSNSCSGIVQIYDPQQPRVLPCPATVPLPSVTDTAVIDWRDQIRMGITAVGTPPAITFTATPSQPYWQNADLRVVLDLSNPADPSIQVRDRFDTNLIPQTSNLLGSCAAPQSTTASIINIGPNLEGVSRAEITTSLPITDQIKKGDIITLGNNLIGKLSRTPTEANSYFVDAVDTGSGKIYVTDPSDGIVANFPVATPLRKSVVSFSNKTFLNYREKRTSPGVSGDNTPIQMLNIDIRGVLDCAGDLMAGTQINDDTDGGLVWFFTVKGPNSNTINDYGVRLYNGRDLVTPINGRSLRGLTVISDQAVYVQGDYNCGPISGLSNPCNNSALNDLNDDRRQPASIMADSLNILSNAWPLDDTWSDQPISTAGQPTKRRPAEATTINAAFLAGVSLTSLTGGLGSDGGGGLNNFPRFHEDWSNGANPSDATQQVPFFYQGSFVSLGAPNKVNGAFCGSGATADCNIFNPPVRYWRYDPLFNRADNLPPLPPRGVYIKQYLYKRNFEQALFPRLLPLWTMNSPFGSWGILNISLKR